MNQRVSRLINLPVEECESLLLHEDDLTVLREALSIAVKLGKKGRVSAIRQRIGALEDKARVAYQAEVFGNKLRAARK
jgi:hypothetical protein